MHTGTYAQNGEGALTWAVDSGGVDRVRVRQGIFWPDTVIFWVAKKAKESLTKQYQTASLTFGAQQEVQMEGDEAPAHAYLLGSV